MNKYLEGEDPDGFGVRHYITEPSISFSVYDRDGLCYSEHFDHNGDLYGIGILDCSDADTPIETDIWINYNDEYPDRHSNVFSEANGLFSFFNPPNCKICRRQLDIEFKSFLFYCKTCGWIKPDERYPWTKIFEVSE